MYQEPFLSLWYDTTWDWTQDMLLREFLSLRVFRLLSSSLLLFPQCFGRYVLQSSSGVCQTQETTWKFELRTLLNLQVACSDSVNHNQVQVLRIPVLLLTCSQDWICNLRIIVFLETYGTNAYNSYSIQ